ALADTLLPVRGTTCRWARWCDRYLDVYVPNLRRSSRSVVASVIRQHLHRAFRRLNVSAIGVAAIQDWIGRMVAADASAASIALRYSVLCKMLRSAKAEGLAARVPRP